MELTFITPALLIPAICLLLLAHNHRFLALASLVRKLHSDYKTGQNANYVLLQIRSLRVRLRLIRLMQALSVFSILMCTVTMFCIYSHWAAVAKAGFAGSLLFFLASLFVSLIEIIKSTRALELQLGDIEEEETKSDFSEIWPLSQSFK